MEHVSEPVERVIDGVAQQMEIDRLKREISMLREVVNSQNATISYLRAKKKRSQSHVPESSICYLLKEARTRERKENTDQEFQARQKRQAR